MAATLTRGITSGSMTLGGALAVSSASTATGSSAAAWSLDQRMDAQPQGSSSAVEEEREPEFPFVNLLIFVAAGEHHVRTVFAAYEETPGQ